MLRTYTSKVCMLVLLMCSLIVLYVHQNQSQLSLLLAKSKLKNIEFGVLKHDEAEKIFIGTVICGERRQLEKALNMMKSAIIFRGQLHIHFLILCSQNLRNQMLAELDNLLGICDNAFTYEIHDPFYPNGKEKFWRFWYAECATARLFMPHIFKDVEVMVYIDNDVLFLHELSDLWQHAKNMNKSQMIAMAPDYLDPKVYEKIGNFPMNKGPSLNDGVCIMNLKKMVEFGWFQYVQIVAEIHYNEFKLADQDIFRYTLLYHPDKVYPLSCKYNFHCMICSSKIHCKDAVTDGIYILHGCIGQLQSHPHFRAIADAFKQYRIGVDPKKHLLDLLKKAVKSMNNKFCGYSTVLSNNTLEELAKD